MSRIKKNNPIEISEDDIFKNDKLKRRDSIIDLSQLIKSNLEPLVLSINASWGSGKTTFVKLWQAYLKKECNVNSIYFSAWEDDFSKEPLISILGELNNYIEKTYPANTPVPQGFNKAIKMTGKVLKRGIPAVIKGSTAGLIDLDAGFEEAISSMSEESTKELIENYSKDKDILKEFKNTLENVLSKMDEDKPFIIFIDELDRCRPLYSIELLERIKHVFGIKRLIFVLSIDKVQLSESIKSQYGNINTNSYLKRFIDLEYTLSNPNLKDFCDYLYDEFNLENILISKGIESKGRNHTFHYLSVMKKLALTFQLSLRDIEQVFIKLHILYNVIDPRLYEAHFRVFVFFEMLKSYNSGLYYDFINKKTNKDKVKELILNKANEEKEVYKDMSIFFETIIESTKNTTEEYIFLINEKKNKLSSFTDQNSYEFKRLQRSIEILNQDIDRWGDYKLNNLIDTVINKIEFIDRFNFENNS